MEKSKVQEKPQLAPPGAGIPFLERWMMRYYFLPKYWKKLSWAGFQDLFDREGEKILQLASSLPAEQLHTPVLVDRISGIEDSSRFWSVVMTMEHLMIVGRAMAFAVTELSEGRVPEKKADTAAFKPTPNLDPAKTQKEFKLFLEEFSQKSKIAPEKQKSRTRFAHPWFGKLNAHQWHGVAAMHQNLHRQQVQAIIKALQNERSG